MSRATVGTGVTRRLRIGWPSLAAVLLVALTSCGAAGSTSGPAAGATPNGSSAAAGGSGSAGGSPSPAGTPRATSGGAPSQLPSASATTSDPFANLPGPQPLPSTAAVTPSRVQVPAIGVDAGLVPLHTNGHGVLVAPASPERVGWYAAGTVPGDAGPAVIAAHVDSRSGPAQFYDLKTMKPGQVITVTRSDGRTVRFRVDGVDQYPKDDFPTEAVYGPTPDPSLRLITCGGTFDYARHHYRDNVVVYASLLG